MRWFGSLRRRSEIAFVRRRGRRVGSALFAGYAAPGRGPLRVGIAAGKDVGGAVERNRARRRLRGALESLPAPHPAGSLFVVARAAVLGAPFDDLRRGLAGALGALERAR